MSLTSGEWIDAIKVQMGELGLLLSAGQLANKPPTMECVALVEDIGKNCDTAKEVWLEEQTP